MWEELYEDHYKELVAYGTRMSGSKELVEGLVQELCLGIRMLWMN